jgi:hypothetical protein
MIRQQWCEQNGLENMESTTNFNATITIEKAWQGLRLKCIGKPTNCK